jgi:hypothetical protein
VITHHMIDSIQHAMHHRGPKFTAVAGPLPVASAARGSSMDTSRRCRSGMMRWSPTQRGATMSSGSAPGLG